MAANLTLRFKLAEKSYRQAATTIEELRCLETMLVELPKHKGTDKMQADIKSRISRLKIQMSVSKPGDSRSSNRIPRQGAGRAVIMGGPNSGKSQLLASLTRATPEIEDYPFTTRKIQLAMMPWEDIKIQLIDTPPISTDVFDPVVQSLIRTSDVVVVMLDLGCDSGSQDLQDLLDNVNRSKTRLQRQTCINSDEIGITYTRGLLAANKIDMAGARDRLDDFHKTCDIDFDAFPISAKFKTGLDALSTAIYRSLDVIRVYTKPPSSKEPDLENPFTIGRGSTLTDLAPLIHKDFASGLKSARVWGSAVHDGTTVKGDYVLNDRDIIELRR